MTSLSFNRCLPLLSPCTRITVVILSFTYILLTFCSSRIDICNTYSSTKALLFCTNFNPEPFSPPPQVPRVSPQVEDGRVQHGGHRVLRRRQDPLLRVQDGEDLQEVVVVGQVREVRHGEGRQPARPHSLELLNDVRRFSRIRDRTRPPWTRRNGVSSWRFRGLEYFGVRINGKWDLKDGP